MKGSYFHLAVVILCFSHLIFLNAVPITRTRNLMLESQDNDISGNTRMVKMKKLIEVERTERKMEVELNDYPGAGSNNRHTPNLRRGCTDC